MEITAHIFTYLNHYNIDYKTMTEFIFVNAITVKIRSFFATRIFFA